MREWDKDKRTEERDAERGDRGREVREVRMRERSGERKRTPPPPTKSLEELFKKTTASPAIYWKPLTEQQIQQRIELRNKVSGACPFSIELCCVCPLPVSLNWN